MKRLALLAAFLALPLLLMPAPIQAQAASGPPTNVYAAGSSFSPGASPAIDGTGFYAHLLAGNCTSSTTASGTTTSCKPTYGVSIYDVLPESVNPFRVTTNLSVGVAQQVFELNGLKVFVPASGGITTTGTNTGWNFTGGGLLDYTFKKNGAPTHWHLMPNARWVCSNVNGGSGCQITGGLLIGLDQ